MAGNVVGHQQSKVDGVAEESSISDALDIAPESRFECPICLAWLRDPVVTACGHRFCSNCIDLWLKKENACCPVDNLKLTRDDIFPDNFTRREISQQRTKCPNIVRGCLQELSPLDVETHLLNCEFRIPESHLPESEKLHCLFGSFGCPHKFEDEPELQRHLENDTQNHFKLFSNICKNLKISEASGSASSAIAQQANFWDPPSKSEVNNHEGSVDSMQGLIKALYEKIVFLEQKNREQEIIITNMSDRISANSTVMSSLPLRYCNGNYVWYLTDFKNKLNTMKNNQHVMYYSPGFYTSCNGYRLCLRFNLSPNDSNYVALLVHMMRSKHDNTLDWPFSGKLVLTIVHPLQSFRNIKETIMTKPDLGAFQRPTEEMNPKGYGYKEFALLEDLLANNFVDDSNQLIIKVTVQPV